MNQKQELRACTKSVLETIILERSISSDEIINESEFDEDLVYSALAMLVKGQQIESTTDNKWELKAENIVGVGR